METQTVTAIPNIDYYHTFVARGELTAEQYGQGSSPSDYVIAPPGPNANELTWPTAPSADYGASQDELFRLDVEWTDQGIRYFDEYNNKDFAPDPRWATIPNNRPVTQNTGPTIYTTIAPSLKSPTGATGDHMSYAPSPTIGIIDGTAAQGFRYNSPTNREIPLPRADTMPLPAENSAMPVYLVTTNNQIPVYY